MISRLLDEADTAILHMLQENARTPNAEIARRLDLAPSAVLERIRKLERHQMIRGYVTHLAPVQGGSARGLRVHGGMGAILRYATERPGKPVVGPTPSSPDSTT